MLHRLAGVQSRCSGSIYLTKQKHIPDKACKGLHSGKLFMIQFSKVQRMFYDTMLRNATKKTQRFQLPAAKICETALYTTSNMWKVKLLNRLLNDSSLHIITPGIFVQAKSPNPLIHRCFLSSFLSGRDLRPETSDGQIHPNTTLTVSGL